MRVIARIDALDSAAPDIVGACRGIGAGRLIWVRRQVRRRVGDGTAEGIAVQLAMAGSLAASGRWPADAPVVVPGIPGPAGAPREALLKRLATSQRIGERAARTIVGHEPEPCPLEHPLVGRLRCGEWLPFAGVHDLLHLDQLSALEASLAGSRP